MYTIGTAGHVDHGKSALVQALTGVDPDRWAEEKERGLTIDLGFAQLTLPGGEQVSIVDVPGHERFIKNMLAGVGGIDLALLVIAADEGVMPQTREHLAIIDLLGVEHGVVALTKADLVDDARLRAAMAEAAEVVGGTTLEGSPIVPCSSVTGDGLESLIAAVGEELAKTPRRRDIRQARLPIDRVFMIAGFGTVVTGTLLDGTFSVGDEVEVLPGGIRARIRGLQNHGEEVETVAPGRRTAVNLSGAAVDDLSRGMVLSAPRTLTATTVLDVRLCVASHIDRGVRHNLSATFHSGSAEVDGRLLLLDADEIAPGESGLAQVRLDGPVAVRRGDHFIVRDPNDTLGGGQVLDIDAPRHRRHHAPTIAALEALEGSTAVQQVARGLTEAAGAATAVEKRLMAELVEYHARHPLRTGMPREELRGRIGLSASAFDVTVERLVGAGRASQAGSAIALRDHRPQLSPEEVRVASAYVSALKAGRYSPPIDGKPLAEVLAYLENAGEVVNMGDGVVFSAAVYREMVDRITVHLVGHREVTLAEVRDMFGTSRRYAQALLEYLDSKHVTRRVGDARVLFGESARA